MSDFLTFICAHAHQAHWVIFLLFLLGGLNIPVSEDILIIGGGAIASTCIPDHTLRLFIWIYLGCIISAWEAYGLGYLLGPRIYTIPLLNSVLTPQRLTVLKTYYAKFGIWTFIVGRFCPGGIRNALFMSSGLTKMPFKLFVLRDSLACIISTTTLFSLGYHFGKNFEQIAHYFREYEEIVIALLLSCLVFFCIRMLIKKIKQDKD